jgi:hypothetical protein
MVVRWLAAACVLFMHASNLHADGPLDGLGRPKGSGIISASGTNPCLPCLQYRHDDARSSQLPPSHAGGSQSAKFLPVIRQITRAENDLRTVSR